MCKPKPTTFLYLNPKHMASMWPLLNKAFHPQSLMPYLLTTPQYLRKSDVVITRRYKDVFKWYMNEHVYDFGSCTVKI